MDSLTKREHKVDAMHASPDSKRVRLSSLVLPKHGASKIMKLPRISIPELIKALRYGFPEIIIFKIFEVLHDDSCLGIY